MSNLSDLIIDHYERHAAAWDRDRQDSGWNDKFGTTVSSTPCRPAPRFLHLGCGSGRPVAQYMAERGLHVTGIDASPTMISLCRERLPDQEWVVADMRHLSLGRRFDGVLA
jgi:ubiquinone/menaquinone biosynthesis C-methylase UbiE